MWLQSLSQRPSIKTLELHHRVVPSPLHLVQALLRTLGDKDFYFEVNNDMYIVQVYEPQDTYIEATQHSKPEVGGVTDFCAQRLVVPGESSVLCIDG